MITFDIIKHSKKSNARLGILKTPHGEVETPTLVPVATQASVKTLTSEEVVAAKSQMLICNTFHLHLKPGEKTIKSAKGLHSFMNWPRPLMTDSGGFQVFSLGFGRDLGVGKIGKATDGAADIIKTNAQPASVKITDEGVWFRSPVDGRKLFLGPKDSIRIQEQLGADIIFAFDECTAPAADHAYTKVSLIKTHRWAKECLELKRTKQAMYGIVQGGKFKDLRQESAKYIGSLPFDGFGIGGEFGNDKKTMEKMIRWVVAELPPEKPRHLLGIGHPEDILKIVKQGVDTFDCIVPTHYARHGTAFTAKGKLDMRKTKLLGDRKPVDPSCACTTCANYSRSYIAHLLKAHEITALRLLTFHNIWFFNTMLEKVRKDIKLGKI